MSPLKPLGRRPRSPGQRSFGGAPHPMGSPAEWHKVVHSPEVQRMLQDPQLASALYQNFRATGGQLPTGMQGPDGVMSPAGGMPPSPVGMQQGGGVPTPEELNQLAQMRGGDVDPATAQQLTMLAQQSRPQRPQRFQYGGSQNESMQQLQAELQQEQAEVTRLRQQPGVSPKAIDDANQKVAATQARISAAAQAQTQPSGPVSLGNTQISGSTMQGLKGLGQQGPPTLGNMAMATGIGALMGGGGTGRGEGALIGGATAALLNYFIRKNAQQKKKQQQDNGWGGGSSGGGGGGDGFHGDQPGPQPSSTGSSTSAPQGGPAAPPLPSGPSLWQGSANVPGGVVTSSDGKNWIGPDPKDPTKNAPVDPNAVANATMLKSLDQPQTTPATTPTTPPSSDLSSLPFNSQIPTLQGLASQAGPYSDSEDTGLARGGPVPHGLGMHHMPIPVLHTTIVIAAKPKKGKGQSEEKAVEKKAMGGEIPQEARRARKPRAIPPIAGPEASGARLPRGRVQVPRGSGAAIKGKRFGGVF